MELVCPAGSLPALKMAVDHGANAVYTGLQDATNARHFAGLNFNHSQLAQGIDYAHQHGVKILLALNTYPQQQLWRQWQYAVDLAADRAIDALIIADIGVLDYAANKYPDLNRHLSVQASATNHAALQFYQQEFAIKRAVLPRVLSLAQVEQLAAQSPVQLEVFGFGSLCIMVEGRCILSSYVTGDSPNTYGACSPAHAVSWQEKPAGLETRLNGILIDCRKQGESAGYPTLCKGRFNSGGRTYYALEEPTSLNTLALLPKLQQMGIGAIKIEGRQRSPAYVKKVTQVWRAALDACMQSTTSYQVQPSWQQVLAQLAEGNQTTLGAYQRAWQ
jgi:putative protease